MARRGNDRFLPCPGQAALRSLPWRADIRRNIGHFIPSVMRSPSNLHWRATIRTYLGGIAETAIIEETAMTTGFTTLDELLNDPMVQLVMKRDGVRPEQLRSMLERVEARSKEAIPPAHVIDSRCRAEQLCL